MMRRVVGVVVVEKNDADTSRVLIEVVTVVVVLLLVRMFGVYRTCLVLTGNDETIVCRLNADFCCFGNSLLDQETKILHRRDR